MRNTHLLIASTFALCVGCGGASQSTQPSETPPPAGPKPTAKAPKKAGTGPSSGDVRESDIDEDGRPEVRKFYVKVPDPERPGQRKSVIIRQELDLTWDGRTDIWRYFDESSGQVTKEEWDLDYDGNVDDTRYFEEGVLVRSERDQNNDGQIDVVRFYANNQLERKETDTNGDGQADRWEYYEGRVLDRVGIDKDHDGTVDTWAKAATQRN